MVLNLREKRPQGLRGRMLREESRGSLDRESRVETRRLPRLPRLHMYPERVVTRDAD